MYLHFLCVLTYVCVNTYHAILRSFGILLVIVPCCAKPVCENIFDL